jgi:hypothetical protein
MKPDDLKAANKRLEVLEIEQRLREGFQNMDARVLTNELSDKQLAILQSEVKPESAQFIRANQEWQRRLTAEQIKSERFAAWVGVAGTICGVIIGWLLSKLV